MRFFLTTSPGLEETLRAELEALGLQRVAIHNGGVAAEGPAEALATLNLRVSTALRVLVPVAEGPAHSAEQLYKLAYEVPWEDVLEANGRLAVHSTGRGGPGLDHSGFAALKVKDAICDRFRDKAGERPDIDTRDPDLSVHLFLSPGLATISLNSSGESLHRRGYRLEGSEASLRETLAAGLIRSTRWDASSPLIDLACGAGTIVIEAARMALNIPAGGDREHSYFRWRKNGIYPGLKEHQRQLQGLGPVREAKEPLIWGFDSDAKVLARAKENAKRAGVESIVRFEQRPIAATRDLPHPGQAGVILCNPPYGERIGEVEELMTLYRELGDVLKHQASGYNAAILTGSKRLAGAIGLRPSKRQPFSNGGLECRLLHFEIYAGSRKPSKNNSAPSGD